LLCADTRYFLLFVSVASKLGYADSPVYGACTSNRLGWTTERLNGAEAQEQKLPASFGPACLFFLGFRHEYRARSETRRTGLERLLSLVLLTDVV